MFIQKIPWILRHDNNGLQFLFLSCDHHQKLFLSEISNWHVVDPLPGSPLVVFVNSKSGGGHGDKFLRRFKQILNPGQVFDLSHDGPTFGYTYFKVYF